MKIMEGCIGRNSTDIMVGCMGENSTDKMGCMYG